MPASAVIPAPGVSMMIAAIKRSVVEEQYLFVMWFINDQIEREEFRMRSEGGLDY